MPQVESRDDFWRRKQLREPPPAPQYRAIEVPANSPNGFVVAFFSVVTGFALIWHIWWMAILGLACAVTTLLVFGWTERTAREISAESLAAADLTRATVSRSP
jgi:cytochrome o ubiquinol oxidase subunit 1